MLISPVWFSSIDPSFPPQLAQYLGDEAPSRIAFIGDPVILNTKAVALICSVKCPGKIILQTYDLAQRLRDTGAAVIGGFHSPMECDCLRILLRGSQPVILCPARGLEAMRITSEHKAALQDGRLLCLSPFSDKVRCATVNTAQFRNRFVVALACQFTRAGRMLVGCTGFDLGEDATNDGGVEDFQLMACRTGKRDGEFSHGTCLGGGDDLSQHPETLAVRGLDFW